jgi:hypothetical protein
MVTPIPSIHALDAAAMRRQASGILTDAGAAMNGATADSRMMIGRYSAPEAANLLACTNEGSQRDSRFVLPADDVVIDRTVQLHVAWRPREAGNGERYPLTPLAEARLIARLPHPGIVTVLDAGSDDRFEYFVTSRLDTDLERVLADHPAGVAVATAIEWMTQVAGTLDFVHRRGFAHRDVRPRNLFLDEIGQVRLGGFDLATAIGEPVDASLVGTPRYMAPEDILGTGSSWTIDRHQCPRRASCHRHAFPVIATRVDRVRVVPPGAPP